MALEKTTEDGPFVNSNGTSTYPYKPDGGDAGVHEIRESNVHNGEANDPQNHNQ